MNTSKLGSIEAIAFIVIIVLNNIVLNLPKSILSSCGSSSILNTIYITILVFIFLFIVFKLFKNFSNSDIIDVSSYLGGKWLQFIVGIAFISLFILVSATTVRNFCEMLKLTYFQKASSAFLVICFIIVAVIANKAGINAIAKCNLIILPLALITLFVIYICIIPRFIPEKVFPIFGNGLNETFFTGATNIFAFSGICYIYFLMPLLKNQQKFSKIGYISIGISAIYLILSITCLLLSLSDVLIINELSPIFLVIRAAEFGRFFQRPDAIFFFVWILSLMSYLSINLLMCTSIFSKITNSKDSSALSYCFAAIIFFIALVPANMSNIRFFENELFKYFILGIGFIGSFLILLFANIKHKYSNLTYLKKGEIANE